MDGLALGSGMQGCAVAECRAVGYEAEKKTVNGISKDMAS